MLAVDGAVATAAGCAVLVAATAKEFGGADILINNAGTSSNETIMDTCTRAAAASILRCDPHARMHRCKCTCAFMVNQSGEQIAPPDSGRFRRARPHSRCRALHFALRSLRHPVQAACIKNYYLYVDDSEIDSYICANENFDNL